MRFHSMAPLPHKAFELIGHQLPAEWDQQIAVDIDANNNNQKPTRSTQ